MKKSSLILVIFFLISICAIQQPVRAQEKSKEDKDKELNDLILEQKKALVDQKAAQEDMKKAMEKTKDDQQKTSVEVRKSIEESKKAYDDAMQELKDNGVDPQVFRRGFRNSGNSGTGWAFSSDKPMIISPDVNFNNFHLFGDSEGTSWEFSKSIRESSFSRDYTFDVESTANTVVMSINGDCKSGEIRIKITMPNGKLYSDILIDESGNLNWRKSFVISDTENKDKAGAWKFDINSSKATGYFKISLQTY
jgi:hypothetical protein